MPRAVNAVVIPAPGIPRAKPLPRKLPEVDEMGHIRSSARRGGRTLARLQIVGPAMRETRATVLDVAEALDVNERLASRTLRGAQPLEVGDIVAIALAGGPGNIRLARRMAARLVQTIDGIETTQLAEQASEGEHSK